MVEKSRILDGRNIRPGDKLIGIAASGLHTNGYSLARNILFDKMKLKPSSRLPGLGITVANELLKVHVSYGPLVQRLLKKFNRGTRRSWAVKGLVHITGGGFMDNIPRVLPDDCNAIIMRGTWDVLPIYELLQASGKVSDAEMHQVFNMGIGFVLAVRPSFVDSVLRQVRKLGERATVIGQVVKGTGEVHLQSGSRRQES